MMRPEYSTSHIFQQSPWQDAIRSSKN